FEALLAVLGYVYGIATLYGVGSFIPMALHTAVSFLVLSFGIMAVQTDRGFLAILTGQSAGGMMARRLLPAAIIVPALLGWLRLEGQRLGFYDTEFGTVLYTVTNMLVFGFIVACNALSVFRTDMKRTKAERNLERAHAKLERRVGERTEQLAQANAKLQKASEELEERVRARTAVLAETEARLHAIVDNATALVHVKNLEGSFVLVNQRFADFLGATKEAILGCRDCDVYPRDLAIALGEDDRRVLAGEAPSETEETLLGAAGARSFISNKFALRRTDGTPYAICGMSRDVTERKSIAVALQKAKDQADRANRAKSEFLSRMSHELRTPMNAILGFAQLLELDELSENQRDAVSHILRGGRHLLELINEVLDISRIEAGHLSLSLEPIEIGETVQETLDLVQTLAAERKVRINSTPCPTCYVLADRQRLKQVMINLVSNAIKYNRLEGSVSIACEKSETHARIRISDTGVGVPAEKLEQLFTPFERLGAEQSAIEGTGLGLTVAKRLVEAMDGKIGVECGAGAGSTFWIELPLTDSPLETAAVNLDDLLPPAAVASNERTLLYVEDNLSNFRLIERLMEHRPGLHLIAAHEGLTGLNLARQHRPDLILLDVNLPDIDGRELLLRLRAEPDCATIPVVVISADATPGQIERLRSAGAVEYLTKPLDIQKFFKVLDRALAGAEAQEV
ncbi:MAG: ATP-binding protein, partial [Chthoniobacterales bacterium]